MSVCVYDSPESMSRECWKDGRLLVAYEMELFFLPEPIPANRFFFGANVGPWNEGQLIGDPRAKEKI